MLGRGRRREQWVRKHSGTQESWIPALTLPWTPWKTGPQALAECWLPFHYSNTIIVWLEISFIFQIGYTRSERLRNRPKVTQSCLTSDTTLLVLQIPLKGMSFLKALTFPTEWGEDLSTVSFSFKRSWVWGFSIINTNISLERCRKYIKCWPSIFTIQRIWVSNKYKGEKVKDWEFTFETTQIWTR